MGIRSGSEGTPSIHDRVRPFPPFSGTPDPRSWPISRSIVDAIAQSRVNRRSAGLMGEPSGARGGFRIERDCRCGGGAHGFGLEIAIRVGKDANVATDWIDRTEGEGAAQQREDRTRGSTRSKVAAVLREAPTCAEPGLGAASGEAGAGAGATESGKPRANAKEEIDGAAIPLDRKRREGAPASVTCVPHRRLRGFPLPTKRRSPVQGLRIADTTVPRRRTPNLGCASREKNFHQEGPILSLTSANLPAPGTPIRGDSPPPAAAAEADISGAAQFLERGLRGGNPTAAFPNVPAGRIAGSKHRRPNR